VLLLDTRCRVATVTEQPTTEQPYTEADVTALAGVLHDAGCGWNCQGHGIVQEANDSRYRRMAEAALRSLAGRLLPEGATPKAWHQGIDSRRDAHQQMFPTHRITTSQDPYGWVCWGAVSEQCAHEIATVDQTRPGKYNVQTRHRMRSDSRPVPINEESTDA
jgi:hypothetical protein